MDEVSQAGALGGEVAALHHAHEEGGVALEVEAVAEVFAFAAQDDGAHVGALGEGIEEGFELGPDVGAKGVPSSGSGQGDDGDEVADFEFEFFHDGLRHV